MADIYRPQFTTSASAHAREQADREELGDYFGDRVSTTTGSVEPVKQRSTTPRPLARSPQQDTPALTDRQRRMLKKKK